MNTADKELANAKTAYYTLQWDGKVFKALTHCDEKKERVVAVILKASDGTEILLGIIPVAVGSSETEHKVMLDLLKRESVPLCNIVAVAFYTTGTAVNSGQCQGIVKRFEESLRHSVLELACRHHILELCCGAASETVLGKAVKETGKKKKTLLLTSFYKNSVQNGTF